MPKSQDSNQKIELAFDTATVLDRFDEDPELREPVERLEHLADRGQLRIVLCQNVVIEAQTPRLYQTRGISKEEALEKLRQWFDHPYILRENVDSRVADIARALAQDHRLTAVDASVAAVAKRRNIPLITRDGKRKESKGGLYQLGDTLGVPIRTAAEQLDEMSGGQMNMY